LRTLVGAPGPGGLQLSYYFRHGRADKRNGRREPIMARLVADFLQVVGIDHVVTVDLHTPQLEA
jgi:ribose-phosphate pyrophosphokinase